MDDMTGFEARFEERLRAFSRTGMRSVDLAAVARLVAAGHPKGAAPKLGNEVQRNRPQAAFVPWKTRSMFKPSLAVAAAVGLLVIGALLTSRREQPVIGNPSSSLPGVVAASPTPSATAPTTPGFPRSTGVWIATGSMLTPRSGHDSVRLLDGRVLVVGGASGDENDTSAELYDPGKGTWSATGNMLKRRAGFPLTLLGDGRVLVGDGDDPNADDEARWNLGAEVYDPASGTWTPAGKMITPTKGATATLLRDGTVLVIGTDGAELYDPDSGTWTATGRMPQRHEYHAAVLLPDGKVLVAGGYVYDQLGYVIGGVQELAELYDPATGTWVSTASMSDPRNPISLTPLSDGKVLVTGGWPTGAEQPLPELYDPARGTWAATGEMARPGTLYGSATLLSDGMVLVTSGPESELYDPDTASWVTTGAMHEEHDARLTPLLDGTVLVAGGQDCSNGNCATKGSAELYVQLACCRQPGCQPR